MQRDRSHPQIRAGFGLALLAALGLFLAACGGGSGGSGAGPRAPVIERFGALPASIHAGESSDLSWAVSGADSVSIEPGIGAVTATTVPVTPTATTAYTLTATNAAGDSTAVATVTVLPAGAVRIAYLHHSTGGNVWAGGVPGFFTAYNAAHETEYEIEALAYPDTAGGYPWANYPYDYWNLWVAHTSATTPPQDRGELNLDQLAASYDVIVFKHCYPVSAIEPANGNPSVSSAAKTLANYQLQYAALKARMHEFPNRQFVVWTGAALVDDATDLAQAQRANEFFGWVKTTWDEPGDNIYVWDFQVLETGGGLYMLDAYGSGGTDSHPNAAFCETVAPLVGQRIVDVIEGRGDTGSLTGE